MAKIKIGHHRKYRTIPIEHLLDPDLSFAAKGLMTWFLIDPKDFEGTTESALDLTGLDKNTFSTLFNELIQFGYIDMGKDGTYNILEKSKKARKVTPVIQTENLQTSEEKEQSEEKKVKRNLYEKCMDAIDEFTDDQRLKDVLKRYLDIRMNPAKGSRLEEKRIPHINNWKAQLKTLSAMRGNKIKIVEQSILNSWAKFVDIETKDNASDSKYTKEELEDIKRLASEIEKQGGKASY